MKKKQNQNYFLKIIGLLFFIFVSLYIALESGYYEAKISKKTAMTEESIKQFENDVREGKPIDLNSYVYVESHDYSNNTTDVAIFIGEKVEQFMSTGLTDFFDLVKTLFS